MVTPTNPEWQRWSELVSGTNAIDAQESYSYEGLIDLQKQTGKGRPPPLSIATLCEHMFRELYSEYQVRKESSSNSQFSRNVVPTNGRDCFRVSNAIEQVSRMSIFYLVKEGA